MNEDLESKSDRSVSGSLAGKVLDSQGNPTYASVIATTIGSVATTILGLLTLLNVTSPIRCYLGVIFTLFGLALTQVTLKPEAAWSRSVVTHCACFASTNGKSCLCVITGGFVMVTAEIVEYGALYFIVGLYLILLAISIHISTSTN